MVLSKLHWQVVAICLFPWVLGICSAVQAVDFAGGTGEPDDPYQIATVEQLIGLGRDPNLYDKHFILIEDLDFGSDQSKSQISMTRAPIAPGPADRDGGGFTGRFDGNHHAVCNLRIFDPNGSNLGLFGTVGPGGRVENLSIENAYIAGLSSLGLLAGTNGGTISQCSVSGVLHGRDEIGGLVGTEGIPGMSRGPGGDWQPGLIEYCHSLCTIDGDGDVGGLVGVNSIGDITCSWADCMIEGSSRVGGLVGRTWSGQISSCYALGRIAGQNRVGGLLGENVRSVVSACYAQAEVSGERVVAGLVADNGDGTICCSYAAGQVVGEGDIAGLVFGNDTGIVHLCYWDTEAAGTEFSAKGEGRTTSQMQSAATFDGWGFEGRWTLDRGHDYPRLAWQNSPGDLLEDIEHGYGGGTGEPDRPYRVETVEDLATISRYAADWSKHFVLVGDIDLTERAVNEIPSIGLCHVPFVGVFDGNDHAIISLQYDRPDEDHVGLFRYVGRAHTDANGLNGIVCNLHLDHVDSTGNDWVAGLAGHNRGTIESCSVSGSIASPRNAGGLLGKNFGIVAHCSSDVTVLRIETRSIGIGDVAGLVTWNEGLIRDCHATGYVDGVSGASAAGGLVAVSLGGVIENSGASANVSSFWGAGGLAGSVSGTLVSYCRASGQVSSSESGSNVGGLIGAMYGQLHSSYATGDVRGSGYVGALVGDNGGTITCCYAVGAVTGSGTLGGLASHEFLGAIIDSYWDCETTGIDMSVGGEPKSTEEMMHAETFHDWDFDHTWTICEGHDYPRLWWESAECEE